MTSDISDRFAICLPYILKEEGNDPDDPNDPGGRTSRGIIQREYNAYRQAQGEPVQDVYRATDAEVSDIYQSQYWRPFCPQLPAGPDLCLFDMNVNGGPTESAKLLQRALGVNDDGHIGIITLAAVKAANPIRLISDFSDQRRAFYRGLRTFKYFGKGWMARVQTIEQAALENGCEGIMTEYACYGCHGLGFVQPIDTLAGWLNANTPKGIHFKIVGGMDPQLDEASIRADIQANLDAGKRLIFVGHSKGAMLAYYLGYPAALVVAIDPTDWGSNIECPNWDLTPPRPGQWEAPDNVTRWINFHQAGYPGGGVLANPGPLREDHYFPDCDHMTIPTDPRTMKIIHAAILGVIS